MWSLNRERLPPKGAKRDTSLRPYPVARTDSLTCTEWGQIAGEENVLRLMPENILQTLSPAIFLECVRLSAPP